MGCLVEGIGSPSACAATFDVPQSEANAVDSRPSKTFTVTVRSLASSSSLNVSHRRPTDKCCCSEAHFKSAIVSSSDNL